MSVDQDVPFDVGLQPERTALAWRRTALALGVGPVVTARLLAPELGGLAAVAAAVGVVLGMGVFACAGIRHRRIHALLTGAHEGGPGGQTGTAPSPARLPGAVLLAATAGVPAVGGCVVLVVVVARLL